MSDTRPPPVSPESLSGVPQARPVVRPASKVAFVFGVLLFIPFVTQVVSLCAGAIAVLRPRLPDERVAIAWIGIAMQQVTGDPGLVVNDRSLGRFSDLGIPRTGRCNHW